MESHNFGMLRATNAAGISYARFYSAGIQLSAPRPLLAALESYHQISPF
jgi:hypothetical protein